MLSSGPGEPVLASSNDVQWSGVTRSGIAYALQGSGPPLLWITGYVVAAASLDRVAAKFADRYTCITFDHRGSGRSRPPLGPMTTGRMARDAVAVLRHIGVESAHVYGVSLGGMVAQELAIQAPHRVRTLILGGTTAGGIGAESPGIRDLLSGLWQARTAFPDRSRVGVLGVVHQGWAAATHDTTARLHRIQAPTLVIHGSDDELVPVSNGHTLARLIPAAELHILHGAGHLSLVDPSTLAKPVATWLDARRTASAPGRRTPLMAAHDLVRAPHRLAVAQMLPTRRILRRLPHAFRRCLD